MSFLTSWTGSTCLFSWKVHSLLLHGFSVTIDVRKIFMSTLSFPVQLDPGFFLPAECFPLTYDLVEFCILRYMIQQFTTQWWVIHAKIIQTNLNYAEKMTQLKNKFLLSKRPSCYFMPTSRGISQCFSNWLIFIKSLNCWSSFFCNSSRTSPKKSNREPERKTTEEALENRSFKKFCKICRKALAQKSKETPVHVFSCRDFPNAQI